MGFEYRVPLTARHGLSLGELGTALQRSGHYVLLPSGDDELAFAYASASRQADWPEDVVLRLTENQLDALLNAGTRLQRKEFITDLSEVLKSRGLHFEIEEL